MRLRPLASLPLRLRLRADKQVNRLMTSAAGRAWLKFRYPQPRKRWIDRPPNLFLEASPHPYALLGHQVSNWMSGYLWARDLNLKFIGGEVSRNDTGVFAFETETVPLPSGAGEEIRYVRLPAVRDERFESSLELLQRVVARHAHRHKRSQIVFKMATDQARWDLTPAADALRRSARSGVLGESLTGARENPGYVALHIRRPVYAGELADSELAYRWIDEEWYVRVLNQLRPALPPDTQFRAYALGSSDDFPKLARSGVDLMLNGDRDSDFVDLCNAAVLVGAPSSFSFNAALVSQGVVLMRRPWWHAVPDTGRWVPVTTAGDFQLDRFAAARRVSARLVG